MDVTLFRWINGWPDSLSPFFVFLSEATKLPLGKALFAVLAIVFLVAGNKTRKALFLGVASILIANEVTDVLKHNWPVLRPCVELANVNMRTGLLTSPGTASAHSANMAALATTFILVWGWRGSFWVPIALFTGLSRIYVGVHYPSQVVFGWTCGALAALIVGKTWGAWVKRRSEKVTETPSLEHPAGLGQLDDPSS